MGQVPTFSVCSGEVIPVPGRSPRTKARTILSSRASSRTNQSPHKLIPGTTRPSSPLSSQSDPCVRHRLGVGKVASCLLSTKKGEMRPMTRLEAAMKATLQARSCSVSPVSTGPLSVPYSRPSIRLSHGLSSVCGRTTLNFPLKSRLAVSRRKSAASA